ncbi:MAG: hypothetical protein M3Y59_16820 [Myxococcota bacterium]|nr:hypothetical protein [Myxococcota bacterium]
MSPHRTLAWVVLLGLSGCSVSVPPPESTAPPAPLVTLFGVRMQVYRGNELSLVGRAAKVAYHRQAAEMVADEALLRFPSRRTGPRAPGNAVAGLEVRAPRVVGNLYSRQAEAQGGVVLRTASGMVGQTQRAQFDGATMKVHGPAPVELTGPVFSLQAQGFDFAFEDELFVFQGETTTVLRPDGGKKK